MVYNHKAVEKKWQTVWDEDKTFAASNKKGKPTFYALVEFPYPSAEGLHVGHPRSYTAMDVISRKRRMQGYNVLFPMGWDAFGLPTENFAIKNKIHPKVVTENNINGFRRQLKELGLSFDWDREINTTDPHYYKWTQWIFLQFFKHGLAYKSEMSVNWCTSCKCVLANEEVVGGVCERCGGEVIHKIKSQWMLKITEYAQRLIDDLDLVDYPDRVRAQQTNWIGRSTGVELAFSTTNDSRVKVFTTRLDTLFGATYIVIAPEHDLVKKWEPILENINEVKAYQEEAARKSDFERTEMVKEKTGVELKGIRAINPATKKEIPIFISDYVLSTYGTGAIMAVPGHDTRDWEFANRFGIDIVEVIKGGDVTKEPYIDTEEGVVVNSGFINGLNVEDAQKTMTEWIEKEKLGKATTQYRLRDWIFSRQRYWGEPIPIIDCPKCGHVPVNEADLPVELPMVESYETTDTGESPLAKITDWVNVDCPKCGGPAKRETDTMPQWGGSSWYYLRYADPHNDKELASKESLEMWSPVDWYNGGMEHTTLHLLYSRFWHKFLYDLKIAPTPEPYIKRTSQGMILGENGEKMSKSRGNVVNPDEIINEFGADTLRLYEMFIGDFEKTAPWSSTSIRGCRRYIERVWNLTNNIVESDKISSKLEADFHRAIKKVDEDIENLKFNTAIATLMALLNDINDKADGKVTRKEMQIYLTLLSPFTPHIAEEMWEILGFTGETTKAPWPKYDEAKTVEDVIEIAIQVNGKVRGRVNVSSDATSEEAIKTAKENDNIIPHIEGKQIIKEIYVQGKLVNLVVKQ